MTAHASRLSMELAALIAEARERRRRRRSLVFLIALVGLAVGLAVGLPLALRSPPVAPDVPRPLTSSLRTGDVRVSVPRGFHSYEFRRDIYMVGNWPPVIGHLLTDIRLPADDDAWGPFGQWAAIGGAGPPANGVALVLRLHGPDPAGTEALHLPLTLGQRFWTGERLKDGAVGFRFGELRTDNGDYDVFYWSGPAAPANDRAAILRALKSIRPAR